LNPALAALVAVIVVLPDVSSETVPLLALTEATAVLPLE
jgi:hypothetical protein